MKTVIFAFSILMVAFAEGEPLGPRRVTYKNDQVVTIAINQEITTMVVTPEPISMIVGSGLTDGTAPGAVQFDHRKGSNVVTFRSLETSSTSYAQIISGSIVYFFRLEISARPDSVVIISNGASGTSSAAVSVDEVIAQRLSYSQEQLRRFAELAKSAPVLQKALPAEYEGFVEVGVSEISRSGDLEIKLEKASRFPKADVIVFSAIGSCRGTAAPFKTEDLSLLIGGSRRMKPSFVSSMPVSFQPGETVRFQLVLAGDGNGKRMHLSIENQFTIVLSSTKTTNR